ncbi:MAG: hypothetical protein JRD89_05225 [Deltaproteobacteria bacterium]|nr:hypothetical protein [Deltaproteobacteria bacterium]
MISIIGILCLGAVAAILVVKSSPGKVNLFTGEITVSEGLSLEERRAVMLHEKQHLRDRKWIVPALFATPAVEAVALYLGAPPVLPMLVWCIFVYAVSEYRARKAMRGR